MRYGHFDEAAREYVIERPDTPKAWTNYVGDTRYGAIVTNHGGGYSFYKSAATGRLLRFRANSTLDGMPGRLFYLRDDDSGVYWAATWQPVGDVAGLTHYECRHGTAYTRITTVVDGIEAQTTYFVPIGAAFEVWMLRLTNLSDRPRNIKVVTFCEFTSNRTLSQDLVNIQYSAYIVMAGWADGSAPTDNPILRIAVNDHLPQDPDNPANNDQSQLTWMSLVGARLTGFDTDRDAFLGPWRSYHNPIAIERGSLSGSMAFGDTACGSLGTSVSLQPDESRSIHVLLGVGEAADAGRSTVAAYHDQARLDSELETLKSYWHRRLNALTVQTPDPAFDQMVNTWGIYNCLITFNWSRAASLVYNGERDGLGFRDTVQDILGVVSSIPEEARSRLELMITGQVFAGGAMPVVRPFSHDPGNERAPDEEDYRSDDCLWLFNTVPALVEETGDLGFYTKVLPFADKGEATVLGHLRRALEFNLSRTGANGLPCGLAADWNDCLKLGYHGESIFVTWQVRYGLLEYARISQQVGDLEQVDWAQDQLGVLDKKISAFCWDGEWFRWAIAEDGTVYGTQDYPEGQVYLNTQAWAVISGAASEQQATLCMDVLENRLGTEFGLILCDPPFVKTNVDVMRAVLFNTGTKENAGIFSHPQSWAVMAECMLGRGDIAFRYHMAYLPSAQNDRAELRQIEPYVHCQSTQGKHSAKFGTSRLPWLTGAATWTYHSATHWILGLRPTARGLEIDPCIPSSWDGFQAKRVLRSKTLNITVTNTNHVWKGVRSIRVDGELVQGAVIDDSLLTDGAAIQVEMC